VYYKTKGNRKKSKESEKTISGTFVCQFIRNFAAEIWETHFV
jgi:hypothetical protein